MIKKIINFILSLFKSNSVYFVGSTDKLPEPLKIEDEIIKISVNNNVIVSDNNSYDIELTKDQAMNIFLNKKMSINELLSSWFYLDIDIYNNDLV